MLGKHDHDDAWNEHVAWTEIPTRNKDSSLKLLGQKGVLDAMRNRVVFPWSNSSGLRSCALDLATGEWVELDEVRSGDVRVTYGYSLSPKLEPGKSCHALGYLYGGIEEVVDHPDKSPAAMTSSLLAFDPATSHITPMDCASLEPRLGATLTTWLPSEEGDASNGAGSDFVILGGLSIEEKASTIHFADPILTNYGSFDAGSIPNATLLRRESHTALSYKHADLSDEQTLDCQVQRHILVFGGNVDTSNGGYAKTNDLVLYDYDSQTIQLVDDAVGEAPPPCSQHAVVLHMGCMIVFGGYVDGTPTRNLSCTNTLYIFEIASKKWHKVNPLSTSKFPPPRSQAQLFIHENSLYLVGGRPAFTGESSMSHFIDLWAIRNVDRLIRRTINSPKVESMPIAIELVKKESELLKSPLIPLSQIQAPPCDELHSELVARCQEKDDTQDVAIQGVLVSKPACAEKMMHGMTEEVVEKRNDATFAKSHQYAQNGELIEANRGGQQKLSPIDQLLREERKQLLEAALVDPGTDDASSDVATVSSLSRTSVEIQDVLNDHVEHRVDEGEENVGIASADEEIIPASHTDTIQLSPDPIVANAAPPLIHNISSSQVFERNDAALQDAAAVITPVKRVLSPSDLALATNRERSQRIAARAVRSSSVTSSLPSAPLASMKRRRSSMVRSRARVVRDEVEEGENSDDDFACTPAQPLKALPNLTNVNDRNIQSAPKSVPGKILITVRRSARKRQSTGSIHLE